MAELVTTTPATVLAIYAHPDDPDVAAGGTLARWAAEGAAVHVCICADGDKGSVELLDDPTELIRRRRGEVAAAGDLLGVRTHHWLEIPDGELGDDPELRFRLVELVRQVRPDTVVAPDPTAVFFGGHYINHRDHRALGWATLDAVAPAAGNPNYYRGTGDPHRVETLYLSGTLEPDVWSDISSTIEVKAAAVACHASQLGDSGEWLRHAVRQRAEDAGRDAGVPYAEGFRRIQLS